MSRVIYESDAESWLAACDDVLNKYWIHLAPKGIPLSKVLRIVEIKKRPRGGYVIVADVSDEYTATFPRKE